MNAVDTNILIYVNDPRDAIKQGIASSLIASMTDGYYFGKLRASI